MPRHDLFVCCIYWNQMQSGFGCNQSKQWRWLSCPFYLLAQFTAALPSTFLHHKAQCPNRCQVESIRDASGSSKQPIQKTWWNLLSCPPWNNALPHQQLPLAAHRPEPPVKPPASASQSPLCAHPAAATAQVQGRIQAGHHLGSSCEGCDCGCVHGRGRGHCCCCCGLQLTWLSLTLMLRLLLLSRPQFWFNLLRLKCLIHLWRAKDKRLRFQWLEVLMRTSPIRLPSPGWVKKKGS